MRLCTECGKPFTLQEPVCPFCLHATTRLEGHLAFAPDLAAESEGFEAHYFARLAQLEAGSFWFRSRNRLVVWALRKYFPHTVNFMEIGCGTGFVLSGIRQAFPELVLSGSEIFSQGLVFAGERLPDVELFQMNAGRIPFREEFDVIGAFDVLEHINEDEEVLSQMYQAVNRGGGILITVPQHPFLWSHTDEYARHVRRYEARGLKEKVRRVGFKVIRSTSFVSLLLPLLILSRFRQRSNSGFDPEAEFNISPLVNQTLERILSIERGLIRAGVSFPVGGSFLLVARRD